MPKEKEKDDKKKATRAFLNAEKVNERYKRIVNLLSHGNSERNKRAKNIKAHDSHGVVVTYEDGKKVKVRGTKAKTHPSRGGTTRKSLNKTSNKYFK